MRAGADGRGSAVKMTQARVCRAEVDRDDRKADYESIRRQVEVASARQRSLEKKLRRLREIGSLRVLFDGSVTRIGGFVNIIIFGCSFALVVSTSAGFPTWFGGVSVVVALMAAAWFGMCLFTPADAEIPARIAILDREREKTISDKADAEWRLPQAWEDLDIAEARYQIAQARYQQLLRAQESLSRVTSTARPPAPEHMGNHVPDPGRISASGRSSGAILALLILSLPLMIASPWPCSLILPALCILALFQRPSACGLCGNRFKRNAYQWKIDGRREWLCIHCNERMERRRSAMGFDQRTSKDS